jgi:hypothetical protein
MEIIDRVTALLTAREARDEKKSQLDEAEAEVSRLEAELAVALREAGTPQVKESGVWFTCTEKKTWTIPEESRDRVYSLLEVNVPEAVKKTVHPGTLSKIANDADASAWRTELRTALVVKVSQGLSVSKSKPKPDAA